MLKNAINKMKNAIKSFNNKLNQAKERICKLEDRSVDTIQSEKKEFRIKKSKEIYINYEAPSNKTIDASGSLRRIREKETENFFKKWLKTL